MKLVSGLSWACNTQTQGLYSIKVIGGTRQSIRPFIASVPHRNNIAGLFPLLQPGINRVEVKFMFKSAN